MQIHAVQRGDSVWRIAQGYGTTVGQIVYANQLDDPGTLVVGQTLVIPDSNLEYILQPGDSLWSVAQRFGTTVQALADLNRIANPASVYVGQMLFLRPPAHPRPEIEVNAYTEQLDEASRREVESLGVHFTYLTPFSYRVREDGSLTPLNEVPLLAAARANRVAPLMAITNFGEEGFSSDLAASILRNPDTQETLLTNVLEIMRSKNYTGLNIDFEYVYPEDRENYNAFLRRTVARLHPEGYSVSTALAPKTRADQPGLLYEAHDYEAHGEIADFVVLMTYEWGWAGGRPWAIAPVNEVKRVLDYAVTAIPPNKILMGMPLYGRDWRIPWVQGTFARTVSPQEAIRLAARYRVAIQYHDTYQSPYFRYYDENGQQHEVWFEDARSVQVKFDAVKQYGLRGVSYWVLGIPFPQNWLVQQYNFQVRKVI